MLPEMRYIERELLPRLRERKAEKDRAAARQLSQWNGERGMCSLMLGLDEASVPELANLPRYDLEEIHYDPEKMFVSELRSALPVAFADGDGVPSVRANVGCGCVNTLTGGLGQTFFPDRMPWLLQHYGPDALAALTAEDISDSAQFAYGLECMRLMKEELEGTCVEVYPMDIQGPVDMAHLWLGNDFFYDVYDEPELVHHALSLAVECDTYAFRKCLEIIHPADHLAHYNCVVLPASAPLKLSEDTSTLLCADHIREYMLPYTRELLERFGGGYIHFCGSNPFLLPEVLGMDRRMTGLNLGNPARHDFASVLPELAARGRQYISTGGAPYPDRGTVRQACAPDGSFHMFFRVTCKKEEQARLLDARDEYVRGALAEK